MEQLSSGRAGQRHFDGELLCDVLERLTRYHAVTFEFTDARLEQLRVSVLSESAI